MSFGASVERWRASARRWAPWAAALYHVQLDESDVLALISIESNGDPTIVSPTGYRGLGQVGASALKDFNDAQSEPDMVDLAWLTDAAHADDQVRVISWHMARGRTTVSTWGMPDAVSNVARWADVRYGWGGGNLRKALARYKAAHGVLPTFPQLEQAEPTAGYDEKRKRYNVRPWHHAGEMVKRAEKDRGNRPVTVPDEQRLTRPFSVVVVTAAFGALGAILVAVGIGAALVRSSRPDKRLD